MSDVDSVADKNDERSESNNDDGCDINNDEIGQEIIDKNHREKLIKFDLLIKKIYR